MITSATEILTACLALVTSFAVAQAVLLRSTRRRLRRTRRALDASEQAHRTDASTGLPNRLALIEAYDNYRATAGEQQASLLMLDLDGLKRINDRHGHAVADEVIFDVAARLAAWTVDRFELAARLHGDEFAILLRDTAADAADTTAQQLRNALSYSFETEGAKIDVTVSIGAATGPAQTTSLSALLKLADEAMYADKRHRPSTTRSRI